MMMRKRAQAAMEFLMTYGWAILVVLLAIGALAYFGVLSPQNLLPERTTFTAPIANLDNAVISMSENSIEVALINNKGVAITLTNTTSGVVDLDSAALACGTVSLSAVDNEGTAIAFGAPGTGTAIPNGGRFLLKWTCDDPVATGTSIGDKFKANLGFYYTNVETGQSIMHTGSVDGKYA
jgi:uncharacterized protein (UPF0333 family)